MSAEELEAFDNMLLNEDNNKEQDTVAKSAGAT